MAHIVSDEVLLFVGVVILAMCVSIDIHMAYKRGAKWLPGHAVVIYALCFQLIGYLDAPNVSTGSRHKDQLKVLVSNQLSIDTSRLVLLVFAGYLLPNLASAHGFWTNIAVLCTSLSTHIAIELSVALHSRVSEKDKVVKGQSGIWLIVSDFVVLESILIFSWLVVWAIGRGRFIRDNLGSRIPLALESPENNNEAIAWDTYQSEMLKSWIVARVSQPEYVLNRSFFSVAVVWVLTFNVVFMGVKVIFLRSQLHGPSPLFTIQSIFIILGWFVVFYRFLVSRLIPSLAQYWSTIDFGDISLSRYVLTISLLTEKILSGYKNIVCRSVVNIVAFCTLICLSLPLLCLLFSGYMGFFVMFFVSLPLTIFSTIFVDLLRERFYSAPPEDEDFPTYRAALKRVCMPEDNAKSLRVANRSSFNHMKQCIEQAYEKGKNSENLQKVIGRRLAEYIPPSEDVKELLEPLKSVRRYFPLLKDSFRMVTALCLRRMVLLIDDFVSQDRCGDICEACKETEDLINFLDCADNIEISMDVINISNLEALMLRGASFRPFNHLRFNFREPPTVGNAREFVEKLFNEAKKELEMCKLLGAFDSQAVDTDWSIAGESYGMYKVCKIILDRPLPDSVEQLQNNLINMLADLIAMCVTESPKILLDRSRKWAAEFREEKISATIKLAGFACGVIDGAKEQHLQLPLQRAVSYA